MTVDEVSNGIRRLQRLFVQAQARGGVDRLVIAEARACSAMFDVIAAIGRLCERLDAEQRQ